MLRGLDRNNIVTLKDATAAVRGRFPDIQGNNVRFTAFMTRVPATKLSLIYPLLPHQISVSSERISRLLVTTKVIGRFTRVFIQYGWCQK